jgi:hypothetical protein
MDVAQLFILAIGAGAAFVTFRLLRHPQARREPFRMWGPASAATAGLGAAAVFAFVALLAWLQGR